MRYVLLTAAACAGLVAPALAQESADKAPTSCAELVDALAVFEATATTVIEDTANGCRMTDFFVMPGSPSRFRVAELTLVAPGLLDDFAVQQLPAEVDLTLDGVVVSPDTGSALTTYMIEMQAEPMTVHLAYRWDKAARTVDLADLSVDTAAFGGFRLAGRFSDTQIDPDALGDLSRMPGVVDRLVVEIENARFAATYFAPPLISMLPYDQDPRPLVANYIAAVNSFIAGLPADNVSADSKAALTSLVSAFPRPMGAYSIDISADPGIPFADLAAENPAELAGLLARIRIAASHTDGVVATSP